MIRFRAIILCIAAGLAVAYRPNAKARLQRLQSSAEPTPAPTPPQPTPPPTPPPTDAPTPSLAQCVSWCHSADASLVLWAERCQKEDKLCAGCEECQAEPVE